MTLEKTFEHRVRSVPSYVSVLMPAYNVSRYLREAIGSVLNQTWQHFELLIIEDCSTDDTAAILATYRDDPRIRILQNPRNLGLAATRNHGLSRARGNYIALLDSDDCWHPEYLEHQVRILDRDPSIAVLGCDFDFIDGDGHDITPENVLTSRAERDPEQALIHYPFEYLIRQSPFVPSTWTTRRALLEKIGRFKPQLRVCEDHEAMLQLSMHGKVCETAKVLAYYRKHGAQLTASRNRFLEFRVQAFESFLADHPDAARHAPAGVFNQRMAVLHREAADYHYWEVRDFRSARKHYLASLRYAPARFKRWKNLLACCSSERQRSALIRLMAR